MMDYSKSMLLNSYNVDLFDIIKKQAMKSMEI
jgi:hypothetical protein